MTRIRPKFDFSPLSPASGDGQTHTDARSRVNALRPELFNEFERVMIEIADTIGDYTVSDTISGSPNTIGGALRYLYQELKTDIDTLYSVKFDTSGGTITGDVTIQTNLDINENLKAGNNGDIGNDLTVGRDMHITGNLTINGSVAIDTSLTIDSDLMHVDVINQKVGIDCVPTTGRMQVNGDLYPFADGQSLGSRTHTLRWAVDATTITGASLYVDSDLIYAEQGSTVVGIECDNPVYTLDINGDVRIRTGNAFYLGGTDTSHLAYLFSYDSAPWRITDLVLNNNVDNGAMFRVVNNVGGALCVAWQSSSAAPTANAATNGRFISGKVYNAIWNDIAETVPSDGTTKPGDLVMVDMRYHRFRATRYDGCTIEAFLGIHSEEPGYIVGWNDEYAHPVFIALKGMVPLTVPNARNRFMVGDRLILLGNIIEAINRTTQSCDPLRTRVLGTVIEIMEDTVRLFLD